MTTVEVMARFGLKRAAVNRWAAQNGVARRPAGKEVSGSPGICSLAVRKYG